MITDLMTLERLQQFAPAFSPEIALPLVAYAPMLERAGLDIPLRLHHFLAQIALETNGFTTLEEEFPYTSQALMTTWPMKFRNNGQAEDFAYHPERIANRVYCSQMENGPEDSGDGWRYRGGGYFMTRGRRAYQLCGFLDRPDDLRTPAAALEAAVGIWSERHINMAADRDDPKAVRFAVKGHFDDMPKLLIWLGSAKRIFR